MGLWEAPSWPMQPSPDGAEPTRQPPRRPAQTPPRPLPQPEAPTYISPLDQERRRRLTSLYSHLLSAYPSFPHPSQPSRGGVRKQFVEEEPRVRLQPRLGEGLVASCPCCPRIEPAGCLA